jgi:hypothetical protein
LISPKGKRCFPFFSNSRIYLGFFIYPDKNNPSGYVEDDCIFTTPVTNSLGPGLWIFTRYEPNQKLELVRIIEGSIVIHFRINLIDNNDSTSTGIWNLTFTALNELGNVMVESIPDKSTELERAIDGLEYFLATGEMMTG